MLNKNEQAPESDIEEQEKREDGIEEKEVGGTLVEKAKELLVDAFERVAEMFRSAEEFGDDEVLSDKEQQEEDELVQEASEAFQRFYLAVKEKLGDAPLSLLLEEGGLDEDPEASLESPSRFRKFIEQRGAPLVAALIDVFVGSNLAETYQKCVEFKEARVDGEMTQEEIGFKEELVAKVKPVSYDFNLRSLEGIRSTIDTNITRLDILNENIKGVMTKKIVDNIDPFYRLRYDLLRKYLGLEQWNDLIQESSYRPGLETESDAVYFTFAPRDVLRSIEFQQEEANSYFRVLPYTGEGFGDLFTYVERTSQIPYSMVTMQMGEYKAYTGFDEERGEKYVSYYDLWDLDPPQLKMLGIDIDQFNFPFEIYGRIYESDFADLKTDDSSGGKDIWPPKKLDPSRF